MSKNSAICLAVKITFALVFHISVPSTPAKENGATSILATTMLDVGSIRERTPLRSVSNQTEPAPDATLNSPEGSARPVRMMLSTFAVAVSMRYSDESVQLATQRDPNATVIAPHGSGIESLATVSLINPPARRGRTSAGRRGKCGRSRVRRRAEGPIL
jgi:hypothetical protein